MTTHTAYHIERGATPMFPVDIAHAVGNHPHEWSRVPWTDEARSAAIPKLREKREAQRKAVDTERANASLTTFMEGHRVTGAQVERQKSPEQRQKDGEFDPGKGDQMEAAQRAADLKQIEEDAAEAQHAADQAQADLDAAKGKGDKPAIAKAQAAYDDAKQKADTARAKVDAAKA